VVEVNLRKPNYPVTSDIREPPLLLEDNTLSKPYVAQVSEYEAGRVRGGRAGKPETESRSCRVSLKCPSART
jgi:hypothetical protein